MAFCTSCGASLGESSKFCPQCGAATALPAAGPVGTVTTTETSPTGAAAQPAMQTAPVQKGGGSALKIILIIFGVIVGLFVLAGAVVGFGIWRFAHKTHIETGKDHARIETPFGTVESNGDATAAMKSLGVDVYPGARGLPGSAAVNFGGFSTAAAEFETPDPPDRVEAFYKARFPRSTVTSGDENHRTMVFSTNKGMITITMEPRGNLTHISVSNVGGMGKPVGKSEPN